MTDVVPDLIPGFTARLQARADELAARRRRRRRRLRLTGLGLASGLVAVSGAYATGLWRPTLGSNPASAPAALESAPTELTTILAPLRRPQTEADRGAAARFALRFPATEHSGIQTRFVRTLAVDGVIVVLVPIVDLRTGAQQLCLWTGGEDGTSRACADAAAVRRGELLIASEPLGSAETEAARAERRRQQGTAPNESGGSRDDGPAPSGVTIVTGVAPDGVRAVRVGSGAPARVEGNLYRLGTTDPPTPLRATWDD